MKNQYIVEFTLEHGEKLYVRCLKPYCYDSNIIYAYKFTNKKEAGKYAKYFKDYILSYKATSEIIRL